MLSYFKKMYISRFDLLAFGKMRDVALFLRIEVIHNALVVRQDIR